MIAATLALALLADAAAATPAPAQKLVPVADFAKHEQYREAKISPNGEYLAVTMWIDGADGLGVIDIKSNKLSGALYFPRHQSVANFWWATPTRIVTEMAIAQGALDQPRLTGELYAMDADGGNKSYLFGYRGATHTGTRLGGPQSEHAWAYMMDPSPGVSNTALIGVVPWSTGKDVAYPVLSMINVISGTRRNVGNLPLFYPFRVAVDDKGMPRFATGFDREGIFTQLVRDAAGGDWRALESKERRDVYGGVRFIVGDTVYLVSNEDTDRTCLRAWKFEARQRSDLACHEVVDYDHLQRLGARSAPAAAVFENGKPETVYLDADSGDARLIRSLNASFDGQRVTVTSYTDDGNKLVLLVDSDRNPGDFYLFDRSTKRAQYLVSRREWIDPASMSSSDPVKYPARDGTTIYGFLTHPQRLPQQKLPLVVLPHGGPHGIRDFWKWDELPQLLASRGYAVLQPNYRGSDGYGRAYQEAGYGKWGTLMQDDLTDGVRWAIAEGIVDPARICIFGGSYGGYAALMSATREPDLYRCAIGFAGVYDLATQREDSDTAETLFGRNYLERVLGHDPKLLAEQSPVTHADRIKAELLIAHGTLDKRVPFSQAKELREVLDKNHKKYEWLAYDGEEHGFFKEDNRVDFYNKLLAFLDRNIGPGAAAAPSTAP